MTREYPVRPIVGIGIVVFSEAGVLLIKRGKPPRVGSWSLPGGAQELGETVEAGACREALEETGISVNLIGLIDVVDSITRDGEGRVHYHYTLVDLAATAEPIPPTPGGDVADAAWVGLDRLGEFELWSETIRVIRLGEQMWRATITQRSRKAVETEE